MTTYLVARCMRFDEILIGTLIFAFVVWLIITIGNKYG